MLEEGTKDSAFLKRLTAALAKEPQSQDDALRLLLEDCKGFQSNSDHEVVERAFEKFGTTVGQEKSWQTAFREAGVLQYALQSLESDGTTVAIKKQYLRVIGNCVSDNDINREIVTASLKRIVALLSSEELTTIVLIVLFNLCNDFDPAKAAIAAIRLDATIAEKLSQEKLPEQAVDYAVDLLTWATENLAAERLNDTTSLKVFADLLKVALQYDEDHHYEYIAILVHYLQDLEFQQAATISDLLDNLVVLLLDFEARITREEIQATFSELTVGKTDDKPPSDETSVLLLTQLINSISAISASDVFATRFDARSPVIERLRAKLNNSQTDYPPSIICACVMLGNLAMSDEVCIDMVSIMQLHERLTEIMFFGKHPALLFAAAGFLRHLAFPEANRTALGNVRLIEACHNIICIFEDAAVLGEVGALVHKLVTNNADNIEKVIIHRLGELRGGPAELPLQSVRGPSALEDIVKKALGPPRPLPSTSMKNPMIEFARIIIAVLRYIGRPTAAGDIQAFQREIVAVPHIARPLAGLIKQRFYADARSEGLLGLGLLAQSAEGATCVVRELKEDTALLHAIKDFAEGKDGGAEQQGTSTGRDYQNAMVLLQALQNNANADMDATMRESITSLQEHLGKLMV